tara:strand:- start:10 stop:573 length:564 start_codon:yes stop_codon:yes gene_type:complete
MSYSNLLKFSDFISLNEAQELSNWILQNKDKEIFKDANMKGKRITTRYSTDINFENPKIAKDIRNKIINLLDLHEEENNKIYPPFKDGVVASCAFEGDTCFEHVDPVWHKGFNTLHCNIITQAPKSGGNLILNGVPEQLNERELICYLVSKFRHATTLVEGTKERLMWVFGFCIQDNKWDNLVEKFK